MNIVPEHDINCSLDEALESIRELHGIISGYAERGEMPDTEEIDQTIKILKSMIFHVSLNAIDFKSQEDYDLFCNTMKLCLRN